MIYLGNQPVGVDVQNLKLIKEYIVQESWANDAKGNGVAVKNAVCNDISIASDEILFLMVSNNTASSYVARFAIYLSTGAGMICRNKQFKDATTAYSFWISAGSIISVYKLKVQEVTQNG